MKTKSEAISYRKLMALVACLLPLSSVRASGDLFDAFSTGFLDSLGYTGQTIVKIKSGTMTEAEATQLQIELDEKGQIVWRTLWHAEFDDALESEGGQPFDLGKYDLDIERSGEGLSAEARHVVDKLILVGISCTGKIDTLVAAKEEDASPTPTIGDKVIYSIVKLLQEDRHLKWPALEDWALLATSENPIYRAIALEAAFYATPQQLAPRNRWKVGEPDLNTEKVLDQGDLVHFSRFLNDASQYIRTKAAKEILARVNTVAIPVEVQQRVQDILSNAP